MTLGFCIVKIKCVFKFSFRSLYPFLVLNSGTLSSKIFKIIETRLTSLFCVKLNQKIFLSIRIQKSTHLKEKKENFNLIKVFFLILINKKQKKILKNKTFKIKKKIFYANAMLVQELLHECHPNMFVTYCVWYPHTRFAIITFFFLFQQFVPFSRLHSLP